jgi:hypothetical protein
MAKIKILLVFLLVSITSQIYGATYYIDALNGKDSNNGISATTPWRTISKVNSFTFKPGDVILFAKGRVWNETLTVRQNGTSAYPIIFGAYGIGTLPVIDGGNTRSYGINISSKAYIIVREFRVQNTTHGAVYVTGSRYITVRNSEMHVTGRAGVFIQQSSYSLIAGNTMTTPSSFYNVQTDGIYAQRNSYNSYDGNYIVISNQHTDQHCDAIQFYQETSAVVKNNYVEQNNTKGGNAQGIYCSENSGIFRIFNNVGYGMHTTSSLIKFKNTTTTGRSEIIGNTLYGGKGGLVQTNDKDIIFKNNIVVSAGDYAVISFDFPVNEKSNIDHNLYKRLTPGAKIVVYDNLAYSSNEWKAAGFDKSGIEADPKFANVTNRDFSLTTLSAAINAGINLPSPYSVDRNGNARPSGLGSDMGAYEMVLVAKNENGNNNTPSALPSEFNLIQNYPNPFNPATTIRFSIPENSNVSIKVYDITGSEVAELINNEMNAGTHEVNFDASNLASGTYIYVLTAKDFVQTKKMQLLK